MTVSLGEILHGGPVDAEEVSRVRDVLVFEGAQLRSKFVKFVCLLVLAAGIATFGLLGDSVAVVIGAMIVAPLMLPIMGLAYSVSIGDRSAMRTVQRCSPSPATWRRPRRWRRCTTR